ncbi:hypothetical protein BZA70DRAFT_259702 [Myxozyma melibiosi]|uniref:Protein DOM34 homolog n=1 Tax=Myxozyma melibiosi TaxID=54550 RepID=A0ABR1F261_9ASCO
MKLLAKSLSKDGAGTMKLLPEEPTDIWHAYNLISAGDVLKATTFRRVAKDARGDDKDSASSSAPSQRIMLELAIRVQKTDYDASAAALHCSGPVVEESPHVRLGAFHTIDLALHRPFRLTKTSQAPWDSVALQTITAACDPASKAEIGAVVLQPGLANICLVTEHMTLLRQRVELSIPGKRAAGSAIAHDKAVNHFYDITAKAMARNLDYEKLKAVIIASPGFTGEKLLQHMFEAASKDTGTASDTAAASKVLLRSRSKFLVVHCASGHVHALNEVLRAPEVRAQLADTKFARETAAIENFFKVLNESAAIDSSASKAWYGPKQVTAAVEGGAVKTLLISDRLFRSYNVGERKKYVALVEQVREQGGEALIFSSLHESGKQLEQFTGIAAILNFPMPELDEISDDEEESEDERR